MKVFVLPLIAVMKPHRTMSWNPVRKLMFFPLSIGFHVQIYFTLLCSYYEFNIFIEVNSSGILTILFWLCLFFKSSTWCICWLNYIQEVEIVSKIDTPNKYRCSCRQLVNMNLNQLINCFNSWLLQVRLSNSLPFPSLCTLHAGVQWIVNFLYLYRI